MTAAGWAGAPPDLHLASHAQPVRAWLTVPGLTDRLLAPPTSLTVTMSALDTPRVVARLTVPATDELATYTDHRAGGTVLIEAGYATAAHRYLDTLAELQLRDRVHDRPSDTLTVTAASADAVLLDRPRPGGFTWSAGTPLATVVRNVLDACLGAGTYSLDTSTAPAYTLPEPLAADPGTDLYDLLETVTDAADTVLYADELGAWHLTAEPVLGTPLLTLSGGATGTVTELSRDLSRDLYATELLLIHEWTTDAGAARRVVGVAALGNTGPGRRTRVVSRSSPTTQAAATSAAAALLRRAQLAGAGTHLDAVADYRLRPGDTVTVADPLTGTAAELVTTVTFDLLNGSMTVTTRRPDIS